MLTCKYSVFFSETKLDKAFAHLPTIFWFISTQLHVMGRGKTLPAAVCNIIITKHLERKSVRRIAEELTIPKSVVHDIVSKYKSTGTAMASKASGRPRCTTSRDDKALRKIIKGHRNATTLEVAREWCDTANVNVSAETCRRRVHELGYSYCRAKEKPLLTAVQKKKRYEWGKQYSQWTLGMWKKVVCVSFVSRRNVVIRTKNEAFHPHCLKRSVKFPQTVMVWGCMSNNGVGNLHFIDGMVNAVKYQCILEQSLLPSLERLHPEGDYVFQEDGASSHTAKST